MLANTDIYEETEQMEKVRANLKSEYEKAMLKGQILIIKLLHNIRTNIVTTMKSQGIKLIEPQKVTTTSAREE